MVIHPVGMTLTCLSCGHQTEIDGPLAHPAAMRCDRCHGTAFVEDVRELRRAEALRARTRRGRYRSMPTTR